MSEQTVQSIIAALRKEAERNPEKTLSQLDTISNTYLTHDSDQIRVDAIQILNATAREHPSEVLPFIDDIVQCLQDNNKQVRKTAEVIIKNISEAPRETIANEEVPDQLLTELDLESIDQGVRNRIINRIVSILLKSTNSRHGGVKISEDEITKLERLAREENADSNTGLNIQKISELVSEIKPQQDDTAIRSDSTAPRHRDPLPNGTDPPIPDPECNTKSTLVKDFSRWDNFSYDDIQQKTVLGRGTADVYEAQIPARKGSNRVVLKEPRFAGELDTDTRESFLEEVRYWAEVADHPHVVDIVGWGESPHPWLVAEYLEGGDLSNRTTELDEALWICARIADALHEAHTLGLRHFDLKPENVLLRRVDDNPWNVPKVSDWGLARFQLDHSGRLSSFTPQYGAPEQFLPEKFDGLDNRTDLYQLGLVLYELTTGEHPFPDRSGAVATEQLHKFPTPPTELDESLPSHLDEITERLLAPQPTDRYDSAAVVRNVIDRLRTGEAVGQEALADRADLYASALEYARGESLRECQRWAKETQKFVANNPVEDVAYEDTREDVASFVDKWFAERELIHGSNHALMTGGDIDLANEHPELNHDIADVAEAVRRLYLRAV